MAIKFLIALCLLFVANVRAEAESEAEADADPYYAYYGRGYGYNHGYGGYGNYYRRSYGYKPAYSTYHRPTYHHTYSAPVHHVAPIQHVAPVQHLAPEPAPAHIEYRQEEPQYVPAIKAFPAVPEEHVHAEHTYQHEAAPEAPAAPLHAAPAAHEVQFHAAPAAHEVQFHTAPVAHAAPVAHVTPAVHYHEAPAAPVSTQYHAQDELGNVIYGYENINSAKQEQRDAYGNVVGSYSYNDATGYPKYVSYVADDFGFRVTSANNLPVAPSAY